MLIFRFKKILSTVLILVSIAALLPITCVDASAKAKKKSEPTASPTPGIVLDASVLANDAFDAINAHRKAKNLPEYVNNELLEEYAKQRAMEISKNFSHDSSIKTDIPLVLVGENLGKGMLMTGQNMVKTWINSSFHKSLIEDRNYTCCAVGVYVDKNLNTYYAVEFM